jgi:hypothetical protein
VHSQQRSAFDQEVGEEIRLASVTVHSWLSNPEHVLGRKDISLPYCSTALI